MAKIFKSGLLALPPYQPMVSQIYLDTKLKLTTKDRHMQAGETRTVELTMVEDYENFEATEVVKDIYIRNPKVFNGEYINVHRVKSGELMVSLRQTAMTSRKKAARDGEAIKTEFLTAAKMLGL